MTDSTRTRQYGLEGTSASVEPALTLESAQYLGRYRIERLLGQGSFGAVYLARDEQLDRRVAIKVPYRNLIPHSADAEGYLSEARTLAQLDHPHIVPVYDFGSTENYPCFIVSKYIEGQTLADRLKNTRLSAVEAADMVATLAETLHFAHGHGIVHRDVKPSNILIDPQGKPYLVDFGLALKEEKFGEGPRFAGTAAYMSPEQARGEGHRVDGRSDVFSLGVIFYELLTGRRPFRGETREELREQIREVEPRPPRQFMDSLPRELERICLRALAKRASERYLTAKDMAEDLRLFLATSGSSTSAQPSGLTTSSLSEGSPGLHESSSLVGSSATSGLQPTTFSEPVRIIPKGLRSFDAHDADFFLELLPGPRDRQGIPESIRFWKTFIEERDADNTFPVGLLYGPSGCGKSSLVKAGLLPRLDENVIAVYIEATAEETETRLLNGLRKRCPALATLPGLTETLTALRQGEGAPPEKKVLIVLDQFEQWLHARRGQPGTELVPALRQCDGGRVQCLVLVRDDFWMTTTRFMRELEVRLLEGQNSAAIDLFDVDHARKVLAAFGRAFGRLPADSLDREQKEFLRQAITDLTQESKIVCVRLALFAEMMKGKPWKPASLKAVGGTEGVGATFLEETFSAATAPPEHRLHQKAARGVLQALLPESGTNIKGNMRSREELLEASGYAGRPADFEELMRILDSEVRLLTPTDPEGEEVTAGATPDGRRMYYQLTHDHLVHSLRSWLTRKQKETRRGRAELLLADLASVWNARTENRQLPSLPQWLTIRFLTRPKHWSDPQRRMMHQAGRYHVVRGIVLAGFLVVLAVMGVSIRSQLIEQSKEQYADALVQRLIVADTSQVPDILKEFGPYRPWTDPRLRDINDRAEPKSRQKLHTSLALLPVDRTHLGYLQARLLDPQFQPGEILVLREALAPYKAEVLQPLWATVTQPAAGNASQRLRAACALAKLDPDNPRWQEIRAAVVDDLVAVHAVHLALWLEALAPISPTLLPPLAAIFRSDERREIERMMATDILAVYAAEQPRFLVDLLLDADRKQYAVLYPKLEAYGGYGVALLLQELQLPSPHEKKSRERLAGRQANAAVALLSLGQSTRVWPLLKHSPDPRLRSYLIHRLPWLTTNAEAVLQQWPREEDVTIRRALLLLLGEFDDKDLGRSERQRLLPIIQEIYRTHPDPGLHAAAEWLLRRWEQTPWIKDRVKEWAEDKAQREQNLERIRRELNNKDTAQPRWFVNGQRQTMVVVPWPQPFRMGSPASEPGRTEEERLHRRRIGRAFAIAATPVTIEQFRHFRPRADFMREENGLIPECPCEGIPWFEMAQYCNYLSDKEGLPKSEWCYEPNEKGVFGNDMKLAANYLSRRGYRVPTEAEWEYAVRAGAVTSRYYGESEELLARYAWYKRNSADHTWPVGRLKPNDLGLFDGLGNVWNFCLNRSGPYPRGEGDDIVDDHEEERLVIRSSDALIVRGGSSARPADRVRCAERGSLAAGSIASDIGFRVARTLR